jgi:NhaP-type Na+/H+ or K+/H+ antiporter
MHSSQQNGTSMVAAVRSFTEQLERIGEVVSVVLLGSMFHIELFQSKMLWMIPILFLIVRPLAVGVGLLGLPMERLQRPLIAWFGIRGIGSIYYLSFVLSRGVKGDMARDLTTIVYCTVVTSIFIHGISGTPFMKFYRQRFRKA